MKLGQERPIIHQTNQEGISTDANNSEPVDRVVVCCGAPFDFFLAQPDRRNQS
jgi:hypothetical protein